MQEESEAEWAGHTKAYLGTIRLIPGATHSLGAPAGQSLRALDNLIAPRFPTDGQR